MAASAMVYWWDKLLCDGFLGVWSYMHMYFLCDHVDLAFIISLAKANLALQYEYVEHPLKVHTGGYIHYILFLKFSRQ